MIIYEARHEERSTLKLHLGMITGKGKMIVKDAIKQRLRLAVL